MSEPGTILLASFAVALLSLDHTAIGQFMFSQPLVGGWVLGLVLGRPLEGLAAGAVLQLLCLKELPVGASIPPDGELAGLTGTALFLTMPRPAQWSDAAVLGLAVLLFFPLAWIGRFAEIAVRRANGRWTDLAAARVREGRYGGAQLAAAGGLTLFFLKPFFIACTVLWLLPLLFPAGGGGGGLLLARPLELLARLSPFAALGVTATVRGGVRSGAAALGFLAGLILCWRLV